MQNWDGLPQVERQGRGRAERLQTIGDPFPYLVSGKLPQQLPGGLILGGKQHQLFGIAKRGLPIPVVPMKGDERQEDLAVVGMTPVGLLQYGDRLLGHPDRVQGHPIDVPMAGVVWLQFRRALQRLDGFLLSAHSHEEQAEGMMHIGIVWYECEGPPEDCLSFFIPFLKAIKISQVHERGVKRRGKTQGRPIRGFGSVELAPFGIQDAKI